VPDDKLFPKRRSSKIGIRDADRSCFPTASAKYDCAVILNFVDDPILVDAVRVSLTSRRGGNVFGSNAWFATVFDRAVDSQIANLKCSLRNHDRYPASLWNRKTPPVGIPCRPNVLQTFIRRFVPETKSRIWYLTSNGTDFNVLQTSE